MLALGTSVQGCVFMCSRLYPRPACMCTEFCVSVVWTQTHTHTYNCILGERSLPGAAVYAFFHF